jgi:hypothetical protein
MGSLGARLEPPDDDPSPVLAYLTSFPGGVSPQFVHQWALRLRVPSDLFHFRRSGTREDAVVSPCRPIRRRGLLSRHGRPSRRLGGWKGGCGLLDCSPEYGEAAAEGVETAEGSRV